MAKSFMIDHVRSSRDMPQGNKSGAGAYSDICQMHTPHLGGQILVLST